ncbi:MAG: RND transporter, partial [Gammaproteobacteria bacterium]
MKQGTKKTLSAYRILILITVAGLVLGGCTVGPDYVRPEADVNPSWLESSETLQEEPAEIREWWTAFDDPVLNRLVQE